jgi:hypothetical protein
MLDFSSFIGDYACEMLVEMLFFALFTIGDNVVFMFLSLDTCFSYLSFDV